MASPPSQIESPPRDAGERVPVSQRAKQGFIWNQIGGILDYGLFLVFSVLVARALGAEEFGFYGTVVSYAAFGLMLISLGMDRAIHVFVPKFEEEKRKAVFLVRRLFRIRLTMGLAVAAGLFLLSPPLLAAMGQPRVGGMLRWMGVYVISMGLSSLFLAWFSARLDLKKARLTKAAIQLVNLIGAIWIYRYGAGAAAVLILLSVTVGLTALAFAWLSRDLFSGPGDHADLGEVRSFCGSQAVMEVLTFITGKNADIIMLNLLLAGTLQVGYYNIAAALTLAISTMLISGAGDIALTATSMMVQKGEPDQLHRAWRFRIKASLILTVPLMVFAFAIAPSLVATLLSEAYLPAAEVFRVAIAGQILMSLLGGGAHGDILLTSGHHKTVRTLRIGFGVMNVVLNLMLIPVWGAIGAAAATAVAAVGLVVSEFIVLRKKQPVVLPGRVMISMFAASAAASAVVLWSSLSGWAFLATATLEFIAVFSLLAWMLKPFDAEDVPIFRRAGFPADRMARFLCRHS